MVSVSVVGLTKFTWNSGIYMLESDIEAAWDLHVWDTHTNVSNYNYFWVLLLTFWGSIIAIGVNLVLGKE